MLSADVQTLCAEWQECLRLRDWRVTIQVCRSFDMPRQTVAGGSEAAHIVRHHHDKSAEIDVLDPNDIDPATPGGPPGTEQSIVHELLHLSLDDWNPEPGTCEYWAQETAINCIADALVALKNGKKAC